MASYTMQLKDIIDQSTIHQASNTRDRIEVGRKKLFDFDYPMFDDAYRKAFETNFIRFFYMREIGFETDGLFKFQLESWLLINMPYFNKLFESELLQFDPLINSSVDITHNKKNDKTQNDNRDTVNNSTTAGSSNSSNDVTSDSTASNEKDATGTFTDDNFERKLMSNMPESRLALTTNDGQGVIEYASTIHEDNENNKRDTSANENSSGVTHSTDVGNTDTTALSESDAIQNDKLLSTINDVEDFIEHRVGKVGIQSYSVMVEEFRRSFIRIEKQILAEMQELFMLVY